MKDGGGNNQSFSGSGAPMAAAEPEPYMDVEMGGGFGDQYSFLGEDTSAQGNGGTQVRHNFTYLNGQDGIGTREASSFQTTNSNQKQSKKEQLLNQQYEMMMQSRGKDVPRPVARQ